MPEPPIRWSQINLGRVESETWLLRVRIDPVDSRRLVTVRVVQAVDALGVPVTEPVSFTCTADSEVAGAVASCTSSGDGRYTVQWPRSWGAHVALSSDLAVGTEIRYTTWAIEVSSSSADG